MLTSCSSLVIAVAGCILSSSALVVNAFSSPAAFVVSNRVAFGRPALSTDGSSSSSSALHLFGKMFEEAGPLGKGITVGKIQVALFSTDRSSSSINGLLESKARASGNSNYELARLTNDVCLALLRKSDDWVSAHSESEWFSENDAGGAESLFNNWANKEAAKFEKEYIPKPGSDEEGNPATTVVVSIVVEILGDSTKFDGAGYSFTGTKEVLSSLAADCQVEDGDCLNAVEVFWTPSDPNEVLTNQDIIIDFPELITL
uniref:Uncharacterized protein n=1 Tax=Helicotheca tamesis TaxID=374047 RepID=A0A7S2HHI5_9STRA|mmetsp:Transcript_18152/g.24976  ORF Transcript_18152/g.24976 Transcript_18152/m.24976 type:complete len:259 (+) Transcript_18152:73-849(+)